MGSLMFLKKFCSLFLLISASILSTSYAGRQMTRSVNNLEEEAIASNYKIQLATETGNQKLNQGAETAIIHERRLRVNTKDYGNYDPAPTFVKPPFKLIPN